MSNQSVFATSAIQVGQAVPPVGPLRTTRTYLPSLILLLTSTLYPQSPPARAIGAVTAIDAPSGQITIKTDAGAEMKLTLKENTSFMKVGLGEKDLKNAA